MAEGSTQGYSSNISNTISNNPFSVSVSPRTTSNTASGDPPPLTNECGFSFLQAFVVSYGTQQATSESTDPTNENERMLPIENMDKVFKMDFSNSGIPDRRIYEVKVKIDQEGNPITAKLQKKPKQGEAGYRPNPQNDTVASENTMYIPVCETINENVTKVWLRENIHWSLPAQEQNHPWKVTDISFFDETNEWTPSVTIAIHTFDDYQRLPPRMGSRLFKTSRLLDDFDSNSLTVFLRANQEFVGSFVSWSWNYSPVVIETSALNEILLEEFVPIHVIAELNIRDFFNEKKVDVKQITRTRLALVDGCINGFPSTVLTGY
jgi:hypothetical protein